MRQLREVREVNVRPAPGALTGSCRWIVMACAALMILFTAPAGVSSAQAQSVEVSHGREFVTDGGTFEVGPQKQGRVITRNFNVRNVGSEPITLGTPIVTGNGFTARLNRTFVRPGKRARLLVQMDTAAAGDPNATITLPFEGAGALPFVFDIVGEVNAPAPRIRASSSNGALVQGSDIFFGFAVEGESVDQTITIRNSGQAPLTLGPVQLTGAGFTVLSQPTSPLNPGKLTRFKIRMLAEQASTPQAMASIATNDPDAESFSFAVFGSVDEFGPLAAVFTANVFLEPGETIDFGSANSGIVLPIQFGLLNFGTDNLNVTSVVSSSVSFVVAIPPQSVIAPGNSSPFFVNFVSALGAASGTITITTDAPGSPFVFNVTGVGVPSPIIQVSIATVTFPRVNATLLIGPLFTGNTSILTFDVKNIGTATLNLGAVSVDGDYMVSEQPVDSSLEPNDTTTFELTITAGGAGTSVDELRIASNDQGANPFRISITTVIDGGGGVPPLRPATASAAPLGSAKLALLQEGKAIGRGGSIDFGSALVGEMVEQEFTVVNTGTAPLSLGVPVVRGSGFIKGRSPDSVVEPGEETTFSVLMLANKPGLAGAVVVLGSNGQGAEDAFVFSVVGRIE